MTPSTSDALQDVDRLNREAWTLVSQWGAGDRMNELETFMWRSERHPGQSSTITTLLLLDTEPEWERLREAHEWAARTVRRLRQRVVTPALPTGPAAWRFDPRFDLDYHLRRVRLPGAGTFDDLITLTQSAALTPFDRSRPLWEATLVEGLGDGGAAYLLKLHHSLTDGMGGVQLLSLLQSRTRTRSPDKPAADTAPSDPVDPVNLALAQLAEQAAALPATATRLLRLGARAVTAPEETLAFAGSLRRTLAAPAPGSPLFRGRDGTAWRLGALECPVSELKAAGKAAGGSLNDAYLAALLGGLRRYHDVHGIHLDALPMAMPVSLRGKDDPLGGNRWAGAMFAGPMGVTDPAERVRATRAATLALRAEPALDAMSLMAPLVNRVPSTVGATAWRRSAIADVSASNVPGMAFESYIAGARVERYFPFGPLPGVAVMSVLVSHRGTCCIGLNMDGSVIGDPDTLLDCLVDGFEEVLALAG